MSSPRPATATIATSTPSALVPLMAPAMLRELACIELAYTGELIGRPGLCQNRKGAVIISDENGVGVRDRMSRVLGSSRRRGDMAEKQKKKDGPAKDGTGSS